MRGPDHWSCLSLFEKAVNNYTSSYSSTAAALSPVLHPEGHHQGKTAALTLADYQSTTDSHCLSPQSVQSAAAVVVERSYCSAIKSTAEMTVKYIRILLTASLLSLAITAWVLLGRHSFLMDKYSEILNRTTPCACHTCISDDNEKRFNKSIDPFLTRENKHSGNAHVWWKRLQADRHDVSYETAVEELFNFFPNNLSFMDSSPRRCRTCAVVGNSGNLIKSHYGALIDIHDVVIRMNQGHVKGYESDVGNKTTLHMMYPESAIDLDKNTHLVFVGFKVTDLRWLVSAFTTGHITRTRTPVKAKITGNKDLVSVLHPAFMRYVHQMWLKKKGAQPSTGFLAVLLSMHICDEVNVFGFGEDKDGNWSHYWEELKNKNLKTGQHDGMFEYKLIVELSNKQKIHFFRGY